jgi:hypothetical protein
VSGAVVDRARLVGQRSDGTFKRCVYPCQKRDADGNRIARQCGVPIAPYALVDGKPPLRGDGTPYPIWTSSGPADAPTLSPSVDCDDKPCWHGHIIDGEVRL